MTIPDLAELDRLRSERPNIEAARDHFQRQTERLLETVDRLTTQLGDARWQEDRQRRELVEQRARIVELEAALNNVLERLREGGSDAT